MRLATLLFLSAVAIFGTPLNAQTLAVERIGTYATGLFDVDATETVVYDAATQRLYVANGDANEVRVLDVSDPASPTEALTIPLGAYGNMHGLAVSTVPYQDLGGNNQEDTMIAVSVEADPETDPGSVVLFNRDGSFREQVTVGALPDYLAFAPLGFRLLVANEGRPRDDYTTDPEGSVTVIDFEVPVSGGPRGVGQSITLNFSAFNEGGTRAGEIAAETSLRIFGPDASVAQDLEPESIAISPDGTTAFVSLQENNGLAIFDLSSGDATVASVQGLGFKDHSQTGNGLDASDRDDAIAIASHPVFGMYQPDGLAAATIDGQTVLFVANEGDSREYAGFDEESRIKNLTLDPTAFPDASSLQADDQLGRLTVTTTLGDTDGDGDYDALYAFGGRSFSVHSADGTRLWESGDEIEQRIAALIDTGDLPRDAFNPSDDENDSFDNRSDAQGPEPESIAVGEVNGTPYLFVGLNRSGAVLIYDVSTPEAPEYAGFLSNRTYSEEAQLLDGSPNPAVGDLGLADLAFIPAHASPVDRALLVTSNAISGTVTLYALGTGSLSTPDAPETRLLLRLSGASPNPSTAPQIAFDLAEPAIVELAVFDARGREVVQTSQRFSAGTDLRLSPDVSELANGVYLYTLEATATGDRSRQSGRFVLAR
ncbi:MAG: choice-of-anchor I family protein [Bacteroidota bacterium]